jgi:hypothetical protein
MLGCAESSDFNKGDCVDHRHWVSNSRELIGNTYTKVVEVTDPPTYIVKQCTLTEDSKNIKVCSNIDALNLYNYKKIKCPL